MCLVVFGYFLHIISSYLLVGFCFMVWINNFKLNVLSHKTKVFLQSNFVTFLYVCYMWKYLSYYFISFIQSCMCTYMCIYVTAVYRLYSAAYRFLDEFSGAVVIKFHQRVPQKWTFRADTLSQWIKTLPLPVFLSEVDPHNLCMMTNLAWPFDWS